MSKRFWQDDPDAQWATLLSTVEKFCHPEAYEDAYESFQRLVKRPDKPEMQVFKQELHDAILDPQRLPKDALLIAAAYDDGSDAKFLARLWRDLYPDEPLPTASR